MKDKMKMSIEELIDAGYTTEMINQIIAEKIAMKTREEQEKKAAEAAEQARKEEIAAARRQYKKAHADLMKALTGEDMSESDMEGFEREVLDPMEKVWELIKKHDKPVTATVRVKAPADIKNLDDVIAGIMASLREV